MDDTPLTDKEIATLRAHGYIDAAHHWTRAGRLACYTFRYRTPVAYAEAMRRGEIRHCVACGKTTVGIKVGARFERGSWATRNRTVCVACHAAGKGLEDGKDQ